MKVIIAGVPMDMADEYAARMIEQGKAIPTPQAPRADKPKAAKSESSIRPELSRPNGRGNSAKGGVISGKRKDVSANEPKDPD